MFFDVIRKAPSSLRPVLWVKETKVPVINHQPGSNYRQTFSLVNICVVMIKMTESLYQLTKPMENLKEVVKFIFDKKYIFVNELKISL